MSLKSRDDCGNEAAGKSPGRYSPLGCPMPCRVLVASWRGSRWGKERDKRLHVVLVGSQHHVDLLIQLPAPASPLQAVLE